MAGGRAGTIDLGRELLRLVASIKAQRDHEEEQLRRAVFVARSAGVTWADIGHSLGVSKQAALQKYGDAKEGAGER